MLAIFLKILVIVLVCGELVYAGKGDYETSIFCYGRLLHDVQVHELFKHPRDFLELRARRSPEVIASRYRDIRPKLKLSEDEGREALKEFIRRNFVNRSSYDYTVPSDWSAELSFQRTIRHNPTLEFLKIQNRKWTQCYYNVTAEARETVRQHSTLPLRHPFHGSSFKSLDYWDSWWIYQGLVASDMLTSARQLIENLAGLLDDYGQIPLENRVYFLGRNAPPFLAIILEDYFNLTGDKDLVARLLPYAELDFHNWIHSKTKKILSAFDVYLVVNDVDIYTSKPRPERYKEDWKRKPNAVRSGLATQTTPHHQDRCVVRDGIIIITTGTDLATNLEPGLTAARMIWDSDPPRGTLSVKVTAITEWSARVLCRLCQDFAGPQRQKLYSLISWELQHTMDSLLYNRKNKQWMDYSSELGHINDTVSLWPVYTGARPWQSHHKVPIVNNLEEALVSVVALENAGLASTARELAARSLAKAANASFLDLKNSSLAIVLIRRFPDIQFPHGGAEVSPVHTRILVIALPMAVATLICLPFLFVKVHNA